MPSFFAASISAGVIAAGAGAWARIGSANMVAAASAVVPLRMLRRVNVVVVHGVLLLHLEQLAVFFLDLVALLLDRDGVFLEGLDVLQRLAAGLFLGLRVQ